MPIEIKELVIRAAVDAESVKKPAGGDTAEPAAPKQNKLRDYLESLMKYVQNENER